MASVILISFIVLYVAEFIFDTWLVLLNARYASSADRTVPEELRAAIDEEKYLKSTRYTIAKSKYALITSVISLLILVIVLLTGTFEHLDAFLRSVIASDIWRGIVYLFIVMLAATFIGLPADIFYTFVLEERFGFNKTTPKLYIFDFFKGIALNIVIMAPLLYIVFYFVEKAGAYWWLYAATGVILIQLGLAYIFPVLIAPLFNKFTPLADEELRVKINQLAEKIKFPLREIKVMDGSKRSKHSNAYFTGFGKHKRIVLFDTLLASMTHDEILAVLAHEIGHWKFKHVFKRMAGAILISYVIFFLLSLAITYEPFFHAFGVSRTSLYLGFILFGLLFSPLMYWTSPLFAYLSRRNEYQADQFAKEQIPQSQALPSALIKLTAENLDNLHPHPFYAQFFYSHPTILDRLNALKS